MTRWMKGKGINYIIFTRKVIMIVILVSGADFFVLSMASFFGHNNDTSWRVVAKLFSFCGYLQTKLWWDMTNQNQNMLLARLANSGSSFQSTDEGKIIQNTFFEYHSFIVVCSHMPNKWYASASSDKHRPSKRR